jgi:type I site-specific restriction endonuclease
MSRRRYRSRSSSGGFAALIGLLIIVWLIIKLIWWILGAAALFALFYLARVLIRENRKRRDAIARYQDAIAALADQQHQWVMQGDDRGIYGSECTTSSREKRSHPRQPRIKLLCGVSAPSELDSPDDSKAPDTARRSGQAKEESHGLGLFIRSLVGLDRQAAIEAFGTFLDNTKFTAEQVRFIHLIVDELTDNGVMEPARLYESPYTDNAPTGPESVFAEADVDGIVGILDTVRANALPTDGAA